MIELGKSLQIEVNAEGVETPEQLQFLFESGCDEVQGFLFARPMPVSRFRDWSAGFLGNQESSVASATSASGETMCKVLDFGQRRNPSYPATHPKAT
ncbi:MAG: EAL domain-containing protein [Bryobacterales bacterium]|nr:EAL domain-containing protein [Bryobacterales bacterium]